MPSIPLLPPPPIMVSDSMNARALTAQNINTMFNSPTMKNPY